MEPTEAPAGAHGSPLGDDSTLDAAIVGGGPAGLAAALWLARYRRSVVVVDDGDPRNAVSRAVHGYPGLPDPTPAELRRRLREQAEAVGASAIDARVASVTGAKDRFVVRTECGLSFDARRILLAYGRRDHVPDILGLSECYGTSVHHCPDCDGPNIAGETVGVIGWSRQAAGLSLFLRTWSDRVILLLHGHPSDIEEHDLEILRDQGIPIRPEPVHRLHHEAGHLRAVEFTSGQELPLRHLFFHIGTSPGSPIARELGLAADAHGDLWTTEGQETSRAGVYAAGDIAGHPYLACVAAAEGVRAALAMHRSLLPSEFELGANP